MMDHLKHRLNPATIAREAVETFESRVLPSGADEVSNALFNGSAYLPWPNQGEQLIQPMPDMDLGQPIQAQEILPPEPTPLVSLPSYEHEGMDR